MGPPQLKEYAVEPVGVAMMTPSPQKIFRNSLSMYDSIVIIDVVSFLEIVTSFKAKGKNTPNFGEIISITERSEILVFPAKI